MRMKEIKIILKKSFDGFPQQIVKIYDFSQDIVCDEKNDFFCLKYFKKGLDIKASYTV